MMAMSAAEAVERERREMIKCALFCPINTYLRFKTHCIIYILNTVEYRYRWNMKKKKNEKKKKASNNKTRTTS
jgi:hypothetical protein